MATFTIDEEKDDPAVVAALSMRRRPPWSLGIHQPLAPPLLQNPTMASVANEQRRKEKLHDILVERILGLPTPNPHPGPTHALNVSYSISESRSAVISPAASTSEPPVVKGDESAPARPVAAVLPAAEIKQEIRDLSASKGSSRPVVFPRAVRPLPRAQSTLYVSLMRSSSRDISVFIFVCHFVFFVCVLFINLRGSDDARRPEHCPDPPPQAQGGGGGRENRRDRPENRGIERKSLKIDR